MAASQRTSQAPAFPYWPFDGLSLYTQMMRDLGGCAQAVTRSTDAMEAARAEADLGVRLYADLMQGWYSLALAPWTAMAAVMTQQLQEDRLVSPKAAAGATPLRTARARSR